MALTESVVLSRTRAQDLNSVRKLNCWGSELVDVSIIRNMPHVEVLALSVNKLTTLADFSCCKNLQELYIRKNLIADLSEVCYLQDLPKLRNLWLADNPCAEGDKYRLNVLRALPHLQKLDNITVHPEEVERAKIHGSILIHPKDVLRKEHISPSDPQSSSCSLPQSVLHLSEGIHDTSGVVEVEKDYYNSDAQESHDVGNSPCSQRSIESEPMKKEAYSPQMHVEGSHNLHLADSDQCSQSVSSSQGTPFMGSQPSPFHQHAFHARMQTLVDHFGKRARKSADFNCECVARALATEEHTDVKGLKLSHEDHSPMDIQHSYCTESEGPTTPGNGRLPRHGIMEHRISASELYGNQNDGPLHADHCCGGNVPPKNEKGSPTRLLPKGGRNRNANILSAVLCLVKELDYASLEVVETAIHCRMEEMDD